MRLAPYQGKKWSRFQPARSRKVGQISTGVNNAVWRLEGPVQLTHQTPDKNVQRMYPKNLQGLMPKYVSATRSFESNWRFDQSGIRPICR